MSIILTDDGERLYCTVCGEGWPYEFECDAFTMDDIIMMERSHGQCYWDNEGDDTVTITDMKPRTVYTITYHCPCEDGDGEMEAFWTGEIDAWGKRTFRPVNGGPEVYLFDHEIGLIAE